MGPGWLMLNLIRDRKPVVRIWPERSLTWILACRADLLGQPG
jgi:hypothetical protein